ncbi:hypothetical protein Lal_00048576 [Lupinus albus]|nr:hypothetical protein Lal_00048576 [Lupinus albus]
MGRSWSNQSTMFLLSPCPSGKCSVEVVVLGEPFMGVAAAPWVKFPIIRKCTLGCSTRLEPWGGRGRINQQCFSCRLVPRKSVLSRCRPGLTVQGWFVAGSLGIVVASTEARCSRKVVVLGEPFLGVSAAPCMGQVPKHPEVHPGLFNTVGAMGRSWSNQSAMFLLSPCPSGKCSVEVPAWPHSAELVCCGDPSELSCLLLWHVLHGRLWCSVNPSWAYMQSTKGRGSCLPAHAPWWVRMACHGAPSQRPSKLSQACWCVFPWRCGKFDRVKNSPCRIQVVRVPVLAGPTEKCGHLVVSLSGTMTHLACSKFFACSSRSKSKILMPSSLWSRCRSGITVGSCGHPSDVPRHPV